MPCASKIIINQSTGAKFAGRMLMELFPGVNFIIVLCAASARSDPKSIKR